MLEFKMKVAWGKQQNEKNEFTVCRTIFEKETNYVVPTWGSTSSEVKRAAPYLGVPGSNLL